MFEITPELDAALDGQAKWMMSIINNYKGKQQIKSLDAEEMFADFSGFYIEHRHKYEPERGARSTFVFQLFRSFLHRKTKKNRITTRNVAADIVSGCIMFDEDEIELIEQFQVQPRKSASRLAKDLGRTVRHVEDTLDSLQAKVAKRNSKQRAVVCK